MTVLMPANCWKNCSPQPTTRARSTCLLVQNLTAKAPHPREGEQTLPSLETHLQHIYTSLKHITLRYCKLLVQAFHKSTNIAYSAVRHYQLLDTDCSVAYLYTGHPQNGVVGFGNYKAVNIINLYPMACSHNCYCFFCCHPLATPCSPTHPSSPSCTAGSPP